MHQETGKGIVLWDFIYTVSTYYVYIYAFLRYFGWCLYGSLASLTTCMLVCIYS